MPYLISNAENLMVKILAQKKSALTLSEVAEEIQKIDPALLSGKTPKNSLYSIIYRRERRREKNGEKKLFRTHVDRRNVLYTLNNPPINKK